MIKKLILPITFIGKNLTEVISAKIKNDYEGKCVNEGYINPNSTTIIRYSSGVIERGNQIVFQVVFECDVCFLVEGTKISCVVKNVTKAGIRAESSTYVPSPIVVFVAKDHHFNIPEFNEIKIGDPITVKVIGQRFELNDKFVSIIGEFVKEKKYDHRYDPKNMGKSKPLIVIEGTVI
jgi:DNA-directed RNA polymerase subunit E'/Rpb7